MKPQHVATILSNLVAAPGSVLKYALDDEATHHGDAIPFLLGLHRHTDGYVSFAVADEDAFVPRFAIHIPKLANMLPEFAAQLMKDAYVSINASLRPRRFTPKDNPALGLPLHNKDNLRYLCACYADLDCYKYGIDTATAVGKVLAFQDQGILPPASMIVRSGRGIWLFWYLCDAANPEHAQCAYPEKIEQYSRIQRALGERLHSLGADVGARDPSRYVRHPGSLNTKSGETVSWLIQGGPTGLPIYTLSLLADLLQLEERSERDDLASRRAFSKDPTRTSLPARRKGFAALTARRLTEFRTLQALRGGFKEGCRNRAAVLYVTLLRCSGLQIPQVVEEVRKFAAACSPPLSAAQQAGAVTYGMCSSLLTFRDCTISDWLDITPEESGHLLKLKPASRFCAVKSDVPGNNRVTADVRRQQITEHINACKRIPSAREMAAYLTSQGIRIGHTQVRKDYRLLGIPVGSDRLSKSPFPLQLTLLELPLI